jgi:hypothetical protein
MKIPGSSKCVRNLPFVAGAAALKRSIGDLPGV